MEKKAPPTDDGMNFNVNAEEGGGRRRRKKKQQPVISAGIARREVGGAGVAARVAPRCNLFQPLSRGNLKVGFKRGNVAVTAEGLRSARCERLCTHDLPPRRRRIKDY